MCVYRKCMEPELKFEDILEYVNQCVQEYSGRYLSDVEIKILKWTWEGLSYEDMAKQMDYSPNTLRGVYGYGLWRLLSNVWPDEKKINKARFNQVVERRYRHQFNQKTSSSPAPTLIPQAQSDNVSRPKRLSQVVNILRSGHHSLVLTGAKGIGKSYLLKTLEAELTDQFSQVIRHPDHEVPTWQTWHRELFRSATEPSLE